MTAPSTETQVAIVGGGPVGLGLAIELGQRGVATTLIEKTTDIHHVPKGQNLTQRTMEHFRSWGVEDAIRESRVMPPGSPAVGVNAYGKLLSEYAHPWFRRSDVDQFYFARNERLPQYLTERVLRDRVAELDTVDARYGIAVDAVHQDKSGAYVTTSAGTIAADFVVGCDGSRSLVRQQAGIGESQSDHDKRMVLLVFRSKQLQNNLAERFGQAAFFSILHPELDGYWRFLGTVDAAETWFFHAPVPADATTDSIDHAALLYDAVGTEFDLEVDYVGFWDLRIAIADSYRQGRLFIGGDAAHSHPPYGGYGINTGFEDARNLGWKLAAVMDGWAGDQLLDSYTQERRAVFESTARDFIERFIKDDRSFIHRHDPDVDKQDFEQAWEHRRSGSGRAVNQFEPHYEGSPLVFGPPGGRSGAIGSHGPFARPGHHLPPPSQPPNADPFRDLGADFCVIAATATGNLANDFKSAADDLGVPIRVMELSDSSLSEYQASSILVRPDHYVAWAGNGDPVDATTVLRRAVGG